MNKRKVGLLVMAYGTPYKLSDIKRYYTHIRNGREPSQEAIDALRANYEAIGGISPMARITDAQTNELENTLNDMQDDIEFKAYLGLRHIEPFIEDTIIQMKKDGIEDAISIVLAPHYSTMSIEAYNERAQKEATKQQMTLTSVNQWYDDERFIQYWTKAINETYAKISPTEKEKAMLIVSAHSLPEKILQQNDPYIDQLKETAALIAESTDIADYTIGWQSEGNTPDPWLQPDVLDLTKQLYEKGYRTFVYAPVGFVSDHLETLYDNDIECKEICDELGAAYYRPQMPNTDPLFIEAMASVVLQQFNKVK